MIRTLVIASLFTVNSAFSDDWPQYRGPNADGKSTETIGALNWGAGGPKELWRTETPLGFSSFSVVAGQASTIVAREADDGVIRETLVVLDAGSGRELWSAALSNSDYESKGGNAGAPDNRGGDGPRSTPTADGERIFVYDSHLVLSAYDAASGKRLWSHDILADFAGRNIKWYNATSPLLHGDLLYVAGGGAGQSLLAFNKKTGELAWKSGDETMTHASPCIEEINGKLQVIFFVQSGLVSLDARSGEELWRTKFPFSVSTAASPVVSGAQIYCSAGYGVGAGVFRASDQAEAEEVWFKSNELMNHWSTPVVHEGYLYGIYEFKKYGKAPLQCVELATGEIKWSERGFGPGNCIMVGDKLVVLSDAGEVAIVKASPDGYQEVARAQVLKGKCWSTPAYSNGRIYVRSTQEAVCLDVGSN